MMAATAAVSLLPSSGVGMTPLRQAVLSVIRGANHPVSAYETLEHARAALGRRLFPPTIYRCLDYLCRHRLIVRIESQNAFLARLDPGAPPGDALLLCGRCGSAQEIGNAELSSVIDLDAVARGFRVEQRTVEVKGICAMCLNITSQVKTT